MSPGSGFPQIVTYLVRRLSSQREVLGYHVFGSLIRRIDLLLENVNGPISNCSDGGQFEPAGRRYHPSDVRAKLYPMSFVEGYLVGDGRVTTITLSLLLHASSGATVWSTISESDGAMHRHTPPASLSEGV